MSVLTKIQQLEPTQSTLLHAEIVGDWLVEIREFENILWITINGESVQSLIDMQVPARLALPNLQTMLAAFLFSDKAASLINLGFGGGAFERFFADRLPALDVISVEICSGIICMARRYFGTPEHVHAVNASAANYLRREQGQHDIIFCDLFAGVRQSNSLFDRSFYADAFRCLKSTGVLAINLYPVEEQELLEALLPLREHFPWVFLSEVPEHGNIVLFALPCTPPSNDILAYRALTLAA